MRLSLRERNESACSIPEAKACASCRLEKRILRKRESEQGTPNNRRVNATNADRLINLKSLKRNRERQMVLNVYGGPSSPSFISGKDDWVEAKFLVYRCRFSGDT
ncbi:hypothetical protein CEXT_580171 [Caerostris extrusa]|uniref:Uncharacterized protein n=1 Tax=Caerostris extrusa TaxID=172846 RepID=A0AAV4RBH0_CAEEX|nr:hypothetical protein CEXT_580171 [Caerostris extrusa]